MNDGQLQINELTAILNEHFHWNKARMGCFVGILIALMSIVAHFIMKLFGFTENDFFLSLDRTNWKWGKTNINLLVLAVVYKGAAITLRLFNHDNFRF